MTEEEWADSQSRCLGLRLAGDAIEEVDDMGEPIVGDTFLILLNADHEPVPFVLPAHEARVLLGAGARHPRLGRRGRAGRLSAPASTTGSRAARSRCCACAAIPAPAKEPDHAT